jgi:hypothetical protein
MNAFLLAWRPFIDPLNLASAWWILLVPLALGISITYKAVRVRTLREYPGQVAAMTVQIIVAMILLGAASFLFIEYLVPFIAPLG